MSTQDGGPTGRKTLEMSQAEQTHTSMTIIRVKRKRSECPLDALVVELGRQAEEDSTNGLVTQRTSNALGNGAASLALRSGQPTSQYFRLLDTVNEERDSMSHLHSRIHAATTTYSSPSSLVKQDHGDHQVLKRARLRLVGRSESMAQVGKGGQVQDNVRLFDAVRDDEEDESSKRLSVLEQLRLASEKADADVDHFLPMLAEHLSLNDTKVDGKDHTSFASTKSSTPSLAGQPIRGTEEEEEEGEEEGEGGYVYDIYYKENVNSYQEDTLGRVGSLVLMGNDVIFMEDPDEEEELVADEGDGYDSNAEDFYANDYPDEETTEEELANWEESEEEWAGEDGYVD